jgi:nicotinamidase-related amidase
MSEDFEDHCWRDVVSPEALKIYKTFRRETRVGVRPALLAVDLWRRVYRGGAVPPHELSDRNPSACGIYAWEAIAPTQALFAAVRAARLPIFYTTTSAVLHGNVQPMNPATRRVLDGVQFWDDDFEIKEEFAPEPGDIMIYKDRASGFFGTSLVAHLNRLGVNSLIVCGESTSGCVRAAVLDAHALGYHVTLAEECVFDRYELTHKINMFDMHHKYADVMKVDEIVAHLKRTGNSSFADDDRAVRSGR